MSLNLTRPGPDPDRVARRTFWRQQRDALNSLEKSRSDGLLKQALEARLRALLAARTARLPLVVGVFWPIRNEPDLRSLWQQWQQAGAGDAGVQLALPKVQGRGLPLQFLAWDMDSNLLDGLYGARLPETTRTALTPELLIVPCLAFRRVAAGVIRLGYGGGFYDRTLARQQCRTWGVAYRWQEDEDLQAQAHDCLLDLMVTD
jgi:5-formyltetrahydrofolate cyclo-ligase